jgi:hypothetical protein
MMARYAHLDPGTIKAAVDRLAVLHPLGGIKAEQNGYQNGHQPTTAPLSDVLAAEVSA